jgi:hypothetical protein
MGLILTSDNPDLEVLTYFWDKDHPLFQVEPNLAPPLVVYAELIGTGDSRNQETAKKYTMSTNNLSTDKISPHIISFVKGLEDVLGDQAYDFLLIGATARDIP